MYLGELVTPVILDLTAIQVLIVTRAHLHRNMGSVLHPQGHLTTNISWEGGAKLIYYLLSAAVEPSDGAGGNLSSVSKSVSGIIKIWCTSLKQRRRNGKQHAMKSWSL